MSMGQQLGSGAKPGQTAGMTPTAMNQTLPGGQSGRPPANQLQQAMQPKGVMGPVAPGPMPQQMMPFENRALNQQTGQTQANQQSVRTGQQQPYVNPNSVGLRQTGFFNR